MRADGRGGKQTSPNQKAYVPTDEGIGPPCSAIATGILSVLCQKKYFVYFHFLCQKEVDVR